MIVIRKNATENSISIDGQKYDVSVMSKAQKRRLHKKVMGLARAKYEKED